METQPQLLLLQKTMVLVEGVGRRLDPDGQHLEPGAAAGRGMDAREPRPRGAAAGSGSRRSAKSLDEVPRLMRGLDKLVGEWSQEGVVLHAETLAMNAAHRARLLPLVVVPLWVAAAALVAIALALLFGR